jgi:hypothetical protein
MTQCKDDTRELSTARSAGCVQRVRVGSRVASTTRANAAGMALERSVVGVMARGMFGLATPTFTVTVAASPWPVRESPTQRSSGPATATRHGSASGHPSERPDTSSIWRSNAGKSFDQIAARDAVKGGNYRRTMRTIPALSLLNGFARSATARSTERNRLPWVWAISFQRVAA